jgi:hypothetical protein
VIFPRAHSAKGIYKIKDKKAIQNQRYLPSKRISSYSLPIVHHNWGRGDCDKAALGRNERSLTGVGLQ